MDLIPAGSEWPEVTPAAQAEAHRRAFADTRRPRLLCCESRGLGPEPLCDCDLDAASRRIEQAAADLDFELCPPDAAERAGFAKPPERVTGVFEHRPPCLGC